MPAFDDPRKNRLLAALPESEWTQWRPHLEPVELTFGQVLSEPDSKFTHVYFPISSIISLLYVTAEGDSAELAVVGHEGILGVAVFMGGETTRSRAIVQSAGRAVRLDGRVIMDGFKRAAPVMHLLLRYTQALITQMSPDHGARPRRANAGVE